jgi:hypothetical protein
MFAIFAEQFVSSSEAIGALGIDFEASVLFEASNCRIIQTPLERRQLSIAVAGKLDRQAAQRRVVRVAIEKVADAL